MAICTADVFARTSGLDVLVGGPPRGDAGRQDSQYQRARSWPAGETKARCARRRAEAALLQKPLLGQVLARLDVLEWATCTADVFARTGGLDVLVGGPPRGDAGR